jgi:hypothetical protein
MRNCFDMGKYIKWGSGGGGWALEIESFLGPLKWHKPISERHLGPNKLEHFPK